MHACILVWYMRPCSYDSVSWAVCWFVYVLVVLYYVVALYPLVGILGLVSVSMCNIEYRSSWPCGLEHCNAR